MTLWRPGEQELLGALGQDEVNRILRLQRDTLERVARKVDAQQTLDLLCAALEALVPQAFGSVMAFDATGSTLEVLAAPSVPTEAIRRLSGLKPGPQAGSCGTAVFTRTPQYVTNTLDDPRWASLRQWAVDFDVRSCWSHPIIVDDGRVLGAIALSSLASRAPAHFERALLETASQLAGIVVEREREQQQLWRLAHHDHLTGLPNRVLINHQIQLAIARCRRHHGKLALLFIDLDRFKDINDSMGHDAGDRVLQRAARAMADCLRGEDVLARLGGDEFLVLMADVDNVLDVPTVAEKLLERLAQPIRVNGQEHRLSASIGISVYPDDGEDVETLQKHADIAMYEAKARGRSCFEYFQHELTRAVNARVEIAHALAGALERGEIVPWFQPQFEATSGALHGVEVLARWQREGQAVPPDRFIAIAEETGQIGRLGEHLIRQSCSLCVAWWARGLPRFSLALNLSARQLRRGFAETLLGLVGGIGFPLDRLEFEITESLLMERGAESIAELERLRQSGVTIALDDFGTGHSSLAQLKRLPIAKLKIDRSFVTDIPGDANDVVIARTVIAMGHALGLRVVAEGVETGEQRELLRAAGCDLLQGYLCCRPLPAADMAAFLEKRSGPGAGTRGSC